MLVRVSSLLPNILNLLPLGLESQRIDRSVFQFLIGPLQGLELSLHVLLIQVKVVALKWIAMHARVNGHEGLVILWVLGNCRDHLKVS